jgi:hypothetical protein
VRDLIRAAQKESRQEELEELLLEGLNSGQPISVDDAFWKDRREKLVEKHKKSKKRK